MNTTAMLIQQQRPLSSLNGQLKHERNMETDTDKSEFVGVAIYETDRANNRILQADPGL